MNKTIKRLTAFGSIAIMMSLSNQAVALPPPPPPPGNNSTGAPVDDGAIALLLAAAGYGYRQLKLK